MQLLWCNQERHVGYILFKMKVSIKEQEKTFIP